MTQDLHPFRVSLTPVGGSDLVADSFIEFYPDLQSAMDEAVELYSHSYVVKVEDAAGEFQDD